MPVGQKEMSGTSPSSVEPFAESHPAFGGTFLKNILIEPIEPMEPMEGLAHRPENDIFWTGEIKNQKLKMQNWDDEI
jgi:hypothetical protein